MKKNLAIISGTEQFGYHTDSFNYCIYLKDKFNITFISMDAKLPRIDLEGVSVKYIPSSKFKLIRGLNKILFSIFWIIKDNIDISFIIYFKKCGIIKKILKDKKMIVDIRTSEINKDENRRKKINKQLINDISPFDHISVISEGVRKLLNIPKEKSYILPLGGKTLIKYEFDKNIFSENKLSLIYVGTFNERRIEDTIKAFNKISDKYNGIGLEYKLIGYTDNKEEEYRIKKIISENKYDNIKFIGRVPNEELGKYFEDSNIGVSYIPITDYFNHQPPTKTYEYLFNGLYTIATKTFENEKIVNDKNGILIQDNWESFYLCLDQLYNKKFNITKREIINTVEEYSWSAICDGLADYIFSIKK